MSTRGFKAISAFQYCSFHFENSFDIPITHNKIYSERWTFRENAWYLTRVWLWELNASGLLPYYQQFYLKQFKLLQSPPQPKTVMHLPTGRRIGKYILCAELLFSGTGEYRPVTTCRGRHLAGPPQRTWLTRGALRPRHAHIKLPPR